MAIVAGFLLTASANWTQTRGLHGGRLAGLVGLWVLGRLAFWSLAFGANPAWAWLDLAFLPVLTVALAPPLIRAGAWRNIAFLFWLGLLSAAHVLVLAETTLVFVGWGRRGMYLGLDIVVFLMILVGGRVLPFFTGNVLRDLDIRKWPTLDAIALSVAAGFILAEFGIGELHPVTGGCAIVVACLLLLRMRWWGSLHTLAMPILWVLHLAYLWIVLGFLLKAMACAGWVPLTAATHALTAGAMGLFILGMITRVSMGHSGRPLRVTWPVALSYGVLTLAATIRVFGSLLPPTLYPHVLVASGTFWVLAFAIFLMAYARILVTARADGKVG